MPWGLHRRYRTGHLHFITFSCYHRRPLLGTARRRNLFLEIFEQVRARYSFVVVGYVVMPEHVHLLISEPERGTQSTVMQVLKQRFARRVLTELRRRRGPPFVPVQLRGAPSFRAFCERVGTMKSAPRVSHATRGVNAILPQPSLTRTRPGSSSQ